MPILNMFSESLSFLYINRNDGNSYYVARVKDKYNIYMGFDPFNIIYYSKKWYNMFVNYVPYDMSIKHILTMYNNIIVWIRREYFIRLCYYSKLENDNFL